MLSVFLSYARADAPAVDQLARDLRGLGCAPWFDSELAGGSDWWAKILSKIREANVFIFATSTESIESQACLTEFAYARELNRTTIPVLVSHGVNLAALPRDLAILQQVDYTRQDKNALISLVRCLINLDAERPLPAPLPQEPKIPLSYVGELRDAMDAKSLTFDEQSALVLRITDLLRTAGGTEVIDMAIRFRRRRDLFAIIAENIDEVIEKAKRDHPKMGHKGISVSYQGRSLSPKVGSELVADIPQSKLRGKSYAALRAEFTDETIMSALKITHDGRKYQCQGGSFFFIADAVAHATGSIPPTA